MSDYGKINEKEREASLAEPGAPDWIAKMERLFNHYARQASVFDRDDDRQAADCIRALCDLVQLKEWKDKYGKDLIYQRDQPRAWTQAFEACRHPDKPQ
jgi:hypothetical protein